MCCEKICTYSTGSLINAATERTGHIYPARTGWFSPNWEREVPGGIGGLREATLGFGVT